MDLEGYRKSCSGFIKTPNVAAEGLRRYVGLDAPDTTLIFNNPWNNAVMFWKLGLRRSLNLRKIRVPGIMAQYNLLFGAIFADFDADLFALAHENGHALNASVNPEMHQPLYKHLVMPIGSKIYGVEPMGEFKPEIATSFICADEGLATWAAFEYVTRQTEYPAEKAYQYSKKTTGPDFPNPSKLNDAGSLRPQFATAEESLTMFKKAESCSGNEARMQFMAAIIKLQSVQYQIGYSFAARTIQRMGREGIADAEAYVRLAKNPPTRLNDLKNPDRYAKLLLQK